MPTNGLIRAKWDADAPHSHTDAGVPGTFRSWDESLTSHVSGGAKIPDHNEHKAGDHNVALQHIHTQVASESVLINDMPPILESDEGCWQCPCHGGHIFDFKVEVNPYQVYIEDKSVAVESISTMNSGTLHGGKGTLTNGGSEDTFVGI